jgi:thiol-disulfide isomerase/thioredoxin
VGRSDRVRDLERAVDPVQSAAMQITRLNTPAEFVAFVAGDDASPPPGTAADAPLLFLLFFGSEVEETGASWCPDCVMADPVIRGTLARITRRAVHLVECPVGSRADYKGNADHPYRRAPRVRLERIPTLIRWAGGREVGRLVEGECLEPDALLRLAAAD